MSNNADYYFLNGGDEMGNLIRSKDWSKTPLGDPGNWPQSLCTMVAMMLSNPFGMYIAWGSEYIQIYNDGYRPILGESKHPRALGISSLETFSEVWDIIGPMFDDVMDGKAVGFPDFMLPLNRNGTVEECYFDFSYSPIKKENGQVGGVLVTVIETTEKKRAAIEVIETNDRFIKNILQAPVAMCILRGKNHVVEIANDNMLHLWGVKAEQVMNRPIFDGLPEAKNQGLEELVDKVYTTGEKFVANEMPVILPRHGTVETIYVNFVYDALKNPDGNISGIIAIAVEVTEQVEARKKIEESEQRFQAAIEAVEGILWTNNEKGQMVGKQPGWGSLTGQTYEEYQGYGWLTAVHPDDSDKTLQAWKNAVDERRVYIFEHRILTKDDGYRYFATRAVPLANHDGSLREWVGVHTDIHEQKTREQKKDEFISLASHELKTPLTTAKAYLQILEPALENNIKAAKVYAKKAGQSVERLNVLIGELLDVSKINLGKLNYTMSTFNFGEMIAGTVENLQLTSPGHTITSSGEIHGVVTGDKERLQQVVINLLSNAIKYSPNGGNIAISIAQEREMIKVTVKDDGIGIARNSLKKIFEKYHRVEEHALQFQGLGIGLFISYEIIERHNGKLWADSEVGKGSAFYFTIPKSYNS